jgi:hypothetical protein
MASRLTYGKQVKLGAFYVRPTNEYNYDSVKNKGLFTYAKGFDDKSWGAM